MAEDDPRREQQTEEEEEARSARLSDLYERMSRVVQDSLEQAGQFSEEALERALRESRAFGQRMGSYGEDIARVSESLRRDWLNAVSHVREQTRSRLGLERVQAGVLGLVSRLAEQAGSQLERFASRINERLTYHTGEVAGAGDLECTGCGKVLHYEQAGRIPPCPACHNTEFRRRF